MPKTKWVATLQNSRNQTQIVQVNTDGTTLSEATGNIMNLYPHINWSHYEIICIIREGAFLGMLNYQPVRLPDINQRK